MAAKFDTSFAMHGVVMAAKLIDLPSGAQRLDLVLSCEVNSLWQDFRVQWLNFAQSALEIKWEGQKAKVTGYIAGWKDKAGVYRSALVATGVDVVGQAPW